MLLLTGSHTSKGCYKTLKKTISKWIGKYE